MTGMKFDLGKTRFSKILENISQVTNNEGNPNRHLRLSYIGGEMREANLYTHDPAKLHGLNFLARRKKHQEAFYFVRQALELECGKEAANLILKELGIAKRQNITVADMFRIKDALLQEQQKFLERTFPVGTKFVHHHDGRISVFCNFKFSEDENERIRQGLLDHLKEDVKAVVGTYARNEGDRKVLNKEDLIKQGALDPQFESDAHRQSTRLTANGEELDLRALLLESADAGDRRKIARRSMQVYAAKPGDNKDTINRKAFHLSRLQHQTVTSYSFIEIANKIGGAFTGHTGTEFDLHEIVENDQTFYIINLHIEQQCESFRSMEKDEDIDLYKNSSYLRYHEEIRVSAADLASGSGDSLTVTTSPIEIRMDISPTVTPPN